MTVDVNWHGVQIQLERPVFGDTEWRKVAIAKSLRATALANVTPGLMQKVYDCALYGRRVAIPCPVCGKLPWDHTPDMGTRCAPINKYKKGKLRSLFNVTVPRWVGYDELMPIMKMINSGKIEFSGELFKEEENAVQVRGPAEMDVRQRPEDGEEVGEGDPEEETPEEGDKEERKVA